MRGIAAGRTHTLLPSPLPHTLIFPMQLIGGSPQGSQLQVPHNLPRWLNTPPRTHICRSHTLVEGVATKHMRWRRLHRPAHNRTWDLVTSSVIICDRGRVTRATQMCSAQRSTRRASVICVMRRNNLVLHPKFELCNSVMISKCLQDASW